MTIDIQKLAASATITIHIRPEDESPNAQLEGDALRWVENQLDNGNPWAWCDVEIRAEYIGIQGHAYLGACAYESEDAFKAGGYFEQLCTEALDDLATRLGEIDAALSEVRS